MPYKKKLPIRVKLDHSNYELLINALESNANNYDGYVSEMAKKLKHKIEKYGRVETVDGGDNIHSLHFFENEGEYFIWQFLAAASTASIYQDFYFEKSKMVEECIALISNYEQLVKECHQMLKEAYQPCPLLALLESYPKSEQD